MFKGRCGGGGQLLLSRLGGGFWQNVDRGSQKGVGIFLSLSHLSFPILFPPHKARFFYFFKQVLIFCLNTQMQCAVTEMEKVLVIGQNMTKKV